MEIFNLTLNQMLMMFSLILVGFLLRKKTNIPENAGTIMAKLETFVFVPALSMFTQMTKCTVESFKENSVLILYGLIIVVCAIAVSYPLSKCFVRKNADLPENMYQRNIFKYALTFGNYGFMGNFIILGVWGSDMFYKYSLFNFFVAILCSSWGLYILIPKDKNAGILENLKKGLLTPPMIGLVLGMLFGLLDLTRYVPQFLIDAFDSAGDCQGPVAMVLAGFVIGGYNFKELIMKKKVYVVTFLRLVAIPAILMVILKLFGTSEEIMTLALIAFATPLGLNTIVYPAAYGGDTKTGASMTMISHTLSVITIPLMYLIFIVWL
ncbi:MAG: AEC family transporter [Clostridia bacterium]|nr:AEC family transporter [Clostridia bacterium]MBR3576790.1 AEC family transporter [Clostridia bacterium]